MNARDSVILTGEDHVRVGERVHGVDHHFFRDVAHLGDAMPEGVKLSVVGFDTSSLGAVGACPARA
jgi:hypothetical protein